MWYSHCVTSRRKWLHPSEEPFHFPALSIPAQFAAILSPTLVPAAVGRNQLDAVFVLELFIERARVVRLVADEPGREFVEKASGKNLFHKLTLGLNRACSRCGLAVVSIEN
jgi:hypothetical protein